MHLLNTNPTESVAVNREQSFLVHTLKKTVLIKRKFSNSSLHLRQRGNTLNLGDEAKLEEIDGKLGTYTTKSFFRHAQHTDMYACSARSAIKLLYLYPRRKILVHEINETIR